MADETVKEAANLYDREYMKHRPAVPGAKPLLEYLKKRSKVGVITNGLAAAQREKIDVCKIEKSIDFRVVSEEVGFKKPSIEIFQVALRSGGAKHLRQCTWVIRGLLTSSQPTTAASKRFG